ncbi:hypothetical protein BWI93_21510 [Siphonobacter sp. BAB-5385]|uniref:cytochrome C oxidase subunit IV family protein n=1 Tax=unclassified Siphonobacter TaxID=2635712 RepID=UPI000B9E3EC9|nr:MULTISPECIES: cytochrome C oxidase subunit IV family protein [unclassified Siphonobacter]OZI06091.1 hypothetical protein BWI93_21510 [Siphonobacter sp. BAB-5385]PMD95361.1 hypothetical protein BWI97_15190 [Siphonobacter sp. BAB-5405]
MASEYNEYVEKDGKMVAKPQTKKIWRTFWILLLITVLEFVVAFTLPHNMHLLKVSIFVIMTIVKAAYIMGEFMHLSGETKSLFWTIIVPLVFIAWLVLALLLEGGFISSY